ncbi:CRISPR-associated endonuclease Cas2 [Thermofilum pendens]|uniref:CRISPR-associated endoribonuclease Cas2 n=1 Tax=Thermofilum pendens (strain DSM 2475 / Hrk 5) TaxID=368408 RepID=CAS2_THEPD|nr:CRISPR-associated endonuclease Cas2 [Thermofilum pendens]A1RZT9.1 RecName: Full=CRISPR-associated endoribonuclease Cas2 [Thermofilum pendens Hrk 5]ABL78719.1 CRISPR-associated protein Cas2 [Thermofilum pendens Hrk 5]
MIVIVAYDISDEDRRGRLRRYLRRLGLARVNRSVYAGPGTATTAELVAERAKEIVEEGDSVFVIVVREDEYQRAHVFDGRDYYIVSERKYEVY